MKIVEKNIRGGAVRGVSIDGIVDEDVRGRNFKGEEQRDRTTGRVVNSAGRRNFLLFLSDEVAEELRSYGCEIKYTHPRDDNDIPRPYISINVSYNLKPVEVHLIANNVDTMLDETRVGTLNDVDFKNLGLVLEFGREKVHQNGTPFIPLYTSQIWAEIVPNYFGSRYAYLNTPIGTEEETPF